MPYETLSKAIVGTPYQKVLAATDTTPITWTVSKGSLPDGLGLPNSIIAGTPAQKRDYTFTVKAANGISSDAAKKYTITVETATMLDPDSTNYTISIIPPNGWYTSSAAVEIRIAEQYNRGWKKVAVKIDARGSFADYTNEFITTDRIFVYITDNGAVTVQVTAPQRQNPQLQQIYPVLRPSTPTVRVGADQAMLHVDAYDSLSGIATIFVDGQPVSTTDKADISFTNISSTYPQVVVTAVDKAENRST